jgi:hypothetical protein
MGVKQRPGSSAPAPVIAGCVALIGPKWRGNDDLGSGGGMVGRASAGSDVVERV